MRQVKAGFCILSREIFIIHDIRNSKESECFSGMGYGTEIPGLGTGIGTDSLGTLGTGKNIAGTVLEQKTLRQRNSKQSQESWLSRNRLMGLKSLGLLGLRQKSLGHFKDFELMDSNTRARNPWDWKSRPMPISNPSCVCSQQKTVSHCPEFKCLTRILMNVTQPNFFSENFVF